jgi:SanA protein
MHPSLPPEQEKASAPVNAQIMNRFSLLFLASLFLAPMVGAAPAMLPRTPKGRGLRRQRVGRVLLALALLAVAAFLAVYVRVHDNPAPIYESVATVPPMPVAVVFGAQSTILTDRVQAAVDLYKAGKVQKLLLTGDNHVAGYDEPGQMKAQALADGVPARDIVCDYAGFRTYDSVYRARAIFGVTRAVFVTQRYHLHRALYLGRSLGIQVVGLDAARHRYPGQIGFDIREVAATEDTWLDVHLHLRPKFLGPKEPISGSSQERGDKPI